MPTTAGTHLLKNNIAADAFIITQIKNKGAIILGKTNLSEWANFLFSVVLMAIAQ
jgi:amidase